MKNRIVWIDQIKGFAMILMVWGHLLPPIVIKKLIYSFHMPLFFFFSGYLRKERNFVDAINVKTKTLLFPYFVIAIISFPLGFLKDTAFEINTPLFERFLQVFMIKGSVGWNTPIWFLLVLYMLEITYAFFVKININPIIIILFSIPIGYMIYISHIQMLFNFQIVIWMLPIYALGVLTQKYNFFSKVQNKQSIIGLVLIILGIIISIFLTKEVAEIYHSQLDNYFLYLLNSLILIFGISQIFMLLPSSNNLDLLSKHSIFILSTHYLFFYFFQILDHFMFGDILFHYQFLPSIFMMLSTVCSYLIFYIWILPMLPKNKMVQVLHKY